MSKPILPLTVADLRRIVNDPRFKDDAFVFAGTYNDGELVLDMHPDCEVTRVLFPSEITPL